MPPSGNGLADACDGEADDGACGDGAGEDVGDEDGTRERLVFGVGRVWEIARHVVEFWRLSWLFKFPSIILCCCFLVGSVVMA